jgi:diguanylate cyclase (GGDEF)-like protein/PAS domain S-box-containing protein
VSPQPAHAAERRSANAEGFHDAFEHAPVGTALVGDDGRWFEVNASLCRLLAVRRDELLTLSPAELTVPGLEPVSLTALDGGRVETCWLRADGEPAWVSLQAARLPGGGWIVQVGDITERKRAERRLRRLADHDALTWLPNRRRFLEGVAAELERMHEHGEYGALLLLDLDNFKQVNDTAGHLAGDQVLCAAAEVLRRRLRATDVIGRLGGDEFAALVLNVTPRQAAEIAEETMDALRALNVSAGNVRVEVTASIGVVAIDELRDENEDELLAAADRAMYRAKSYRRQA